jgi:hypothetical protein
MAFSSKAECYGFKAACLVADDSHRGYSRPERAAGRQIPKAKVMPGKKTRTTSENHCDLQ